MIRRPSKGVTLALVTGVLASMLVILSPGTAAAEEFLAEKQECRRSSIHRLCVSLDFRTVGNRVEVRVRASLTALASGTRVKVNDVRVQYYYNDEGVLRNAYNNADDDGWHPYPDGDHANTGWHGAGCRPTWYRGRALFEWQRSGNSWNVPVNTEFRTSCSYG